MKKIVTIFICAAFLCTGCGSSSKTSKSEIMGGGGGIGAGIEAPGPGSKSTKKTTKSKSTKKSKTKDTKKTQSTASKDTRDTRDTQKSTPTRRASGSTIGDIMEMKAADMARIDGVRIETVKDSRGNEAIKVTFDSGILFETGKYSLNEYARAALSDFVEEMRDLPETNITVYGHTDNTGSAAANERVSLQRAKSVADYLKREGIAGDRIVYEGKSFREPIADNSTAAGRKLNRRVEVFVFANDRMIRQAREGTL